MKLKHRITFLQLVKEQNEVGDDVLVEKPWRTVWASVEPLQGKEYIEAQKIRPEATYRIYTRYFENVTPDMSIEFKGRKFSIKSVLNVREENRILELYAVEEISK